MTVLSRLGGGWIQTYYDPSYIFSGGQDPQPPGIYAPDADASTVCYDGQNQKLLRVAFISTDYRQYLYWYLDHWYWYLYLSLMYWYWYLYW